MYIESSCLSFIITVFLLHSHPLPMSLFWSPSKSFVYFLLVLDRGLGGKLKRFSGWLRDPSFSCAEPFRSQNSSQWMSLRGVLMKKELACKSFPQLVVLTLKTHSQVTCSSDAHSHMTCSTETHSHKSSGNTTTPPLEKAAFVDGYLHGCSISTLAICQVMYASQHWTTWFVGKWKWHEPEVLLKWNNSTNVSGEKFSNRYILLVQGQWGDSMTEQVKQRDEEVNEEKDTEKSEG